ncbi:MAG: GTPase domain-containing protein [Gemmataceae bacterium]
MTASISSRVAADPPLTASAAALRLVLFGLPQAGKSSLLGALGQAARTQQQALAGRLDDLTGQLFQQTSILYEQRLQPPSEREVTPYPLRYLPTEGPPQELVLLDCQGTAAANLLENEEALESPRPGTLAGEVAQADALLLVVNAHASDLDLLDIFQSFDTFLARMEATRSDRLDVAGWPVFLVLTRCDELAHPGVDYHIDWVERLEQRKAEVAERFREFLRLRLGHQAGEIHDPPRVAFGTLNLFIRAVATRRPALVDRSEQRYEPYQVAELFREAFRQAQQFRQRQQRSSRQLGWLVGLLSSSLLALLLLIAGMLLLNQVSAVTGLSARVEDLRAFDRATPAERLRGTREAIANRTKALQEIRDDPQFKQLSVAQRDWVIERYEELRDYGQFLEKLLLERPVIEQRSEQALQAQIARLQGELKLPSADWLATPAGQLHKARLDEAEAMRAAVQKLRFWYEDERDRLAREMLLERDAERVEWAGWSGRVEKLLDSQRSLPVRPSDPISEDSKLTYQTAMQFDRVLTARAEYDRDRARLQRLLQVASALGLTPPHETRPAVLAFSRDLTLAQLRERWTQLQRAYPEYRKTFAAEGLPLAALRPAIRSRYDNLLVPGREEVLRQLRATGKREEAAAWVSVQRWLKEPTELDAWRSLALLLLRMEDPLAEDPVTALAGFLNREHFELQIDTLELELPLTSGLAPRAEASLDLYLPASGKAPATRFRRIGEPRRDESRRLILYTFRKETAGNLRYQIGEKFWAKLLLSGGRQQLSWGEFRSERYAFECLLLPPRLQDENASSLTEGRRLDDVRLRVQPADGMPRVPDLLPVVRLD